MQQECSSDKASDAHVLHITFTPAQNVKLVLHYRHGEGYLFVYISGGRKLLGEKKIVKEEGIKPKKEMDRKKEKSMRMQVGRC